MIGRWLRRTKAKMTEVNKPHTHCFDTRFGIEPVGVYTSARVVGCVLYCSCGSWRVFYR
jgi:hypothetical protein